MNNLILKIYDLFKKSPALAWGLFILLTAGLIASVVTLSYQEDISDFLPLDKENHTALSVYQDISGANRIFAIVSARDAEADDPQLLADGVEEFVNNVEAADSLRYIGNLIKEVDLESILATADFVYANIPYFLTDADYARIDSLLAQPEYVDRRVAADRESLLFPSAGLQTANISRDPLDLFSPVVGRLTQANMPVKFDTYDGYILTPDGKKAIVIMESAFGAHESEKNALLADMLENAASATETAAPGVEIHLIGGPLIAVGNARQIKSDSVLAVCIAGVLILALLIYVFRSARNILLIVVSVGWGWLFAMGAIALFYDSVSIIVIGIASVILGIAVNYPLHLIDHLRESSHPRAALREIISPLVVGNVTTVGAFLCLVPLDSPALHDLGLFSSLLLVGTILFVLVFLPHAVKTRRSGDQSLTEPKLITRLASMNIEKNRTAIVVILLLTVVFGYFSLHTEFDSDMRNINYMSERQKADMEYFGELLDQKSDRESLYVVSSGATWDEALTAADRLRPIVDSVVDRGMAMRSGNASSFIVSETTQRGRLEKWERFKARYSDLLTEELDKAAVGHGFSAGAFDDFHRILNAEFEPEDFEYFRGFASAVFEGNLSEDSRDGRKSMVEVLSVAPADMESVKARLSAMEDPSRLLFDVRSMNGRIADTLSQDFNYIGVACGCIVFVFLWISLGSIELAIVSFLPMAFSWIWILGIMGILGIKFNIVNVILATFIFGQGDDYTIFMTEGLTYEFAYRKKLLASYKNSIIVSALIMFIGIGTLLVARHPALRSLGEVTVVGMLSVVLMAWLFPPLVFGWLTRRGGRLRYRPVTLRKILFTGFCAIVFFAQLSTAYALGFLLFTLTRPTLGKRRFYRRYICSVFRFDIRRMPGIRFEMLNPSNEDFKRPAVIISNHQSILDSFCIMTLSPNVILLANEHVRMNPLIRPVFRWCGFLTASGGSESIIRQLRPMVEEGYSVVIFPEGERPEATDTDVKRFRKGAFHIAASLGLDIVPVMLAGVREVMPKGSALSNGGTIHIEVGVRMSRAMLDSMGDTASQARAMRDIYRSALMRIHHELADPTRVSQIVADRYLYKGRDIEMRARRTLRAIRSQAATLVGLKGEKTLTVVDRFGEGELALTLALMYPEREIVCRIDDEERRELLRGAMQDFVGNVRVEESEAGVESVGATMIFFEQCEIRVVEK